MVYGITITDRDGILRSDKVQACNSDYAKIFGSEWVRRMGFESDDTDWATHIEDGMYYQQLNTETTALMVRRDNDIVRIISAEEIIAASE